VSEVRIIPVPGIGEVVAGADVGALILDAATGAAVGVEPGDIVVIAQKIVSKAEGRLVPATTREDARAAARREARRVLRDTPSYLIVETHYGLVCANAGVDMSNTPDGYAALLPKDPDASSDRIRLTLEERAGGPVAVIISDSFGRTWRVGQTNVAIGASGMAAVRDYRGEHDPVGRELVVTQIAHLDELASAAELVMGKLDRTPVAIVRGYEWSPAEGGASDLIRPTVDDLFR
jgi:coenzyme F420-0:L-glutamate ligase/coenzyme F420-1:gamma-L-glutamate ligase